MSQYISLRCELPIDLAEAAAFWMHEEGAQGVEVRDEELIPPPGEAPVPEGFARVTGYFSEDSDAEGILERLQGHFPEATFQLERFDDQLWAETWKLHFKPLRVRDSFWVLPPWEERPEGAKAIVIEPGMAFGTGGHETTALCLDILVDALEPGNSVFDLGCGSGILGISAAALGAGRVLMVDNDPVSVTVARENADKNGFPEIETSGAPVETIGERFDLVLANILATTLIDLAEAVVARMKAGGKVVLSGIMVDQAEDVRKAYERLGARFVEERTQGEWSALWMELPG